MHPKIETALAELTKRMPKLTEPFRELRFEMDPETLGVFSIRDEQTLAYHPMLLDEQPQAEVTFALAVMADMILNHVQDRGAGRDVLLWGFAANIVSQTNVSKKLQAPERCRLIEESLEHRFPGLEWRGKTLEQVYNAMVKFEGGQDRASLN